MHKLHDTVQRKILMGIIFDEFSQILMRKILMNAPLHVYYPSSGYYMTNFISLLRCQMHYFITTNFDKMNDLQFINQNFTSYGT